MKLILTVTHRCNLNCTYCYAGDHHQTNVSGEVLTRSMELFRRSPEPEKTLLFFGGEPFLAFDAMKEAARLAREHQEETGCRLRLLVTTNATILKQEHLDWLEENNVKVTVSLDGVQEAHELSRPLAGGGSSFSQVVAGLRALIDAKFAPSVNMVIRPRSATHVARSVRWLYEEGVTSIILSPQHDTHWSIIERSILREQLSKVGLFWANKQRLGVNFLVNIFSRRQERSGSKIRIAVSPRGNLYPCSAFIGADLDEGREAAQRLGHISEAPEALLARLDETRCRPGAYCECAAYLETGDKSSPGPNGLWLSRLYQSLRRELEERQGPPTKKVSGLLFGLGLSVLSSVSISCATLAMENESESLCGLPQEDITCNIPTPPTPPTTAPTTKPAPTSTSLPASIPVVKEEITMLKISSSQRGVRVFVDGKLAGKTTDIKGDKSNKALFSVEVSPGKHKLRFEKRGFLEQTDEFKIRAGQTKTMEVNLREERDMDDFMGGVMVEVE